MELKEMIYRRKSIRSYTGEPVDNETLQKIKAFADGAQPLHPDIKVRWEFVGKEKIKSILPWITPQCLVIFSEDKEGALENVGFIFQQLELYMQSIGLGVCWVGMGRPNSQEVVESESNDALKFVIMLTFGYPKGGALRQDVGEFKRKALSEISDRQDERLEPARLAPSSVNSQPWYFIHEGDAIHVYCAMKGFLKVKTLTDMNRIDMGIALAQLYVAYPGTFKFFKADTARELKGYGYIGSLTL